MSSQFSIPIPPENISSGFLMFSVVTEMEHSLKRVKKRKTKKETR